MDELTKTDQKNLARCERVIQTGLGTFFQVGQALWDIRDNRLYRGRYESFEEYCTARWDFSRQRAYQLITAAETAAEMSTIVDTPPERETHIRPLLAVPKEHRAEVWQAVLEAATTDAEGHPIVTARLVQDQVDLWHQRRKVDQALGPEPEVRDFSDVIDVESHPATTDQVEPEEQPERTYEPDPDYAGESCPEFGSEDLDEDADGRYCRKCKATIDGPGEPDETQEPAPGSSALPITRAERIYDEIKTGMRDLAEEKGPVVARAMVENAIEALWG